MSNFQPLPAGGPNVNPVETVEVAVVPPERRSLPSNKPVPVGSAAEKPAALVVPAEVPSIQSHATTDEPSESHALAQADHDEKGAAQEDHDRFVKDVGWNQHASTVPNLVGGLPNEELWTLVRRFDKQMYHVKTIPYKPLGGLDLNIADKEEFSPDKMRSNIERLYMTVIVGVMTAVKHISRIQSWNEKKRTGAFASVYFIAWLFNLLTPMFLSVAILLILSPKSRTILFPPAPLALVDSKTGNLQKPKSGMLGSHDSLTGAPEKHQGEAVEQEATNFVNGFANLAVSSATGQHPDNGAHGEEGAMATTVPDPTRVVTAASDAKVVAAAGEKAPVKHDKTKQPMEATMWEKARPATHMVADIADGWERFANALSPTPPFPQNAARLKLAAILVPILAVSLVTSPAVLYKISSFISGAAFFSEPLLIKGAKYLNAKYPNWQKLLEIRNSILKGVPTNAQLTLTLLRIGEANHAPIPPPPQSEAPPPEHAKPHDGEELQLNASQAEIDAATHPEPTGTLPGGDTQKKEHPTTHKVGKHIVGLFKSTTKTGIEATLGTDRLKAKAGSEHAKNRLGVLPNKSEQNDSGPVEFKVRHRGKKGSLFLYTNDPTPVVTYYYDDQLRKDGAQPIFTIPIDDIKALRKIGGLGWKTKLIVGWAMDRQIADGLEIVDKMDQSFILTAIQLREELFNRLIAIGQQNWESL